MPKTCSYNQCSYNVFSKGLCLTHWKMQYGKPIRKSVANNSNKRARKPVKKISDKHAKELKEYSKLRVRFLIENPYCQIRKPGCWKDSSEVHHTKGRGKYLLDVSTWKSACGGPCHDNITVNSKKAIEEGHSQRRNTPIERTIFYKNNTHIKT